MKAKGKLNSRDSLELLQVIIDDDRDTEKKSLLEDEKQKHEAVEKALDILKCAGVYAYIYADLPHSSFPPGVPCVYQFNTLQALLEYNENGERTEESSNKNAFFHSALWTSLVNNTIQFTPMSIEHGIDKLDINDPEHHRKRMAFMNWYITMCYRDVSERMREIRENPL